MTISIFITVWYSIVGMFMFFTQYCYFFLINPKFYNMSPISDTHNQAYSTAFV